MYLNQWRQVKVVEQQGQQDKERISKEKQVDHFRITKTRKENVVVTETAAYCVLQ